MKRLAGFILSIGAVILLMLWFNKSIYNQQRYAELRIAKNGEYQVLICAMRWNGFYSIHGFEGYKYCVDFWATLDGSATVYTNPIFHQNMPIPRQKHFGTVSVDIKNSQLVVDLRTLATPDGDETKLKNSPANGTYQIKVINNNPFE